MALRFVKLLIGILQNVILPYSAEYCDIKIDMFVIV